MAHDVTSQMKDLLFGVKEKRIPHVLSAYVNIPPFPKPKRCQMFQCFDYISCDSCLSFHSYFQLFWLTVNVFFYIYLRVFYLVNLYMDEQQKSEQKSEKHTPLLTVAASGSRGTFLRQCPAFYVKLCVSCCFPYNCKQINNHKSQTNF